MKFLSLALIAAAAMSISAAETYSSLTAQAAKLAKQRKSDEAIAAYRKAAALTKRPQEIALAFFRSGSILKDKKMYDAAIVEFEKIISIQGVNRHMLGSSWRAIAQTKMLQGKTRDAIEYYKKAGSVKANTWIDTTANTELAAIYEKLGWYKEALEAHTACLNAKKCTTAGKIASLAGIANAQAKLGNFDEARKELAKLDQFKKVAPQTACRIEMAKASLLDAEKKWDAAIVQYRKVMKMPKIRYTLRRAAGNRAAAIALNELKQVKLASEIMTELTKSDKHGANEELRREIRNALRGKK